MPDIYPSEAEARFGFGKNWQNFLKLLTEDRILAAENSLRSMLRLETLQGKTFLDIGSGSGLFSLAAHRLGAKIVSFDFDQNSVEATQSLRDRFAQKTPPWRVEQGSVLHTDYMRSLGTFDIVYSWGVLHHTGSQWDAIDNAAAAVKPSGLLYIALYNKQGFLSTFWTWVKRIYNHNKPCRYAMTALFVPPITIFQLARSFALTGNPLKHFTEHKDRGMSPFHDILDWIGGYPFEVSSPEEVLGFLRPKGFVLEGLSTTNGHGNNEFLFRKADC